MPCRNVCGDKSGRTAIGTEREPGRTGVRGSGGVGGGSCAGGGAGSSTTGSGSGSGSASSNSRKSGKLSRSNGKFSIKGGSATSLSGGASLCLLSSCLCCCSDFLRRLPNTIVRMTTISGRSNCKMFSISFLHILVQEPCWFRSAGACPPRTLAAAWARDGPSPYGRCSSRSLIPRLIPKFFTTTPTNARTGSCLLLASHPAKRSIAASPYRREYCAVRSKPSHSSVANQTNRR